MVGPIPNSQQSQFGSPSTGHAKEGPTVRDGELEAPENTIPTEQAARTIYDRLKHQHLQRCHTYERIQGMLDGNPPYNPRAMAAAGLHDMANVNWKDGDAVYRSVALAYWSLFNEVKNIIDIKTTFSNDEGQNANWSAILSEEWDKTVRKWPDFTKNMTNHQSHMIKVGLSLLVWADERDWRFKPIDPKAFMFPDQTEDNIEELTLVAVEREYTAQYLWEIYNNLTEGSKGHWDKESLGHILFQLANIPDDDERHIHDCDDLQSRIRNGDFYYTDLYNDSITLVSIFAKEYDDGKISHHMIHRSISTENFPYFFNRQYEHFREALQYFTFSPGEDHIHGSKGIGHNIFSAIEAITHLDCSVLDQARRAGSLLVKSGPNRNQEDRQIRFVHGGVIDVGEAEIQQNTMGNNVAQTVEVSRYFKEKTFANNNISGNDPGFPDKNVRSSNRQAQLQVLKEAKVQKNQIAHYYEQLDHFFGEVVRKMLESRSSYPGHDYVEIWKNSCLERGVPEQVFDVQTADKQPNGLPVFLEVSATRSSGSGSQIADQLTMQRVMEVLPTMGERGKINALMDFVAAFRGHEYVDRYFPPEDRQRQPTGDDTIASIENNQLSEGKQVTVSPDNNHLIHAQNHMRLMAETMQIYNQDPQAQVDDTTNILQFTDQLMSVAGPHFVKHLFFAGQDPTIRAEVQQLNAQWAVLANFGDQIAVNANRQREAELRQLQEQQQALQQQREQNTPEHIKARGQIEIAAKKLEAQIARDRVRDRNKFALAAEQLRQDSKLKELRAANEIALENRKARAADDREGAKTVNEILRQNQIAEAQATNDAQ